MRSAVIVFPGSNCDRDVAGALEAASGVAPVMHWHADPALPKLDLIVVPGGFAYGDYLRCGAMAAHAAVMREVVRQAGRGVPVLGICNGFQILTEAGLLPGVLLANAGISFICRQVTLRAEGGFGDAGLADEGGNLSQEFRADAHGATIMGNFPFCQQKITIDYNILKDIL